MYISAERAFMKLLASDIVDKFIGSPSRDPVEIHRKAYSPRFRVRLSSFGLSSFLLMHIVCSFLFSNETKKQQQWVHELAQARPRRAATRWSHFLRCSDLFLSLLLLHLSREFRTLLCSWRATTPCTFHVSVGDAWESVYSTVTLSTLFRALPSSSLSIPLFILHIIVYSFFSSLYPDSFFYPDIRVHAFSVSPR